MPKIAHDDFCLCRSHRKGGRGEKGCSIILWQESFPFGSSEKAGHRGIIFPLPARMAYLDEVAINQHVAGRTIGREAHTDPAGGLTRHAERTVRAERGDRARP